MSKDETIKNVFLLAADIDSIEIWSSVLSLATNSTVHWRLIDDNSIQIKDSVTTEEVMIVATEKMKEEQLLNVLNSFKEYDIPIICTGGETLQLLNHKELLDYGVRGILNLYQPVVKIFEVLSIVKSGGVFLQSPYTKQV